MQHATEDAAVALVIAASRGKAIHPTARRRCIMDIERASRIAASFADSISLKVHQCKQGIRVQYRQNSCYFTRESSFWIYIFTLAHVAPATVLNPDYSSMMTS